RPAGRRPCAVTHAPDRPARAAAAGGPRPALRPQRRPRVRPARLQRRCRRGTAGAGRQRRRQDHLAARTGRPAARRCRRDRHRRRCRRAGAARAGDRLPRPPARAEGRPQRAGEPRIPVRPAGAPPRPVAGTCARDCRAGRLRGRARAATVGRAEEAPVTGPPVAVPGTVVAAGRALRQPRPGRHRTGQPDGAGAPARRRRGTGDHPWCLCRPARPHPAAGDDPTRRPARRMQATSPLPGLPGTASALMRRALRLLWRRRGDALQPALFALLVIVLFALALGGEAKVLASVAPAVLWVAVLLSGLLALDTLFRGDAEDGSLEQWMLAPVPLAWLVGVRTFMHWATTALPLLLATPCLAELMHLPRGQLPVLMASLALGTPLLSLLGAVVAALTVGM